MSLPAAATPFDLNVMAGNLGDVEEIGAAQVFVALLLAGVDARGVDGDLDGRFEGFGFVEIHGTADFGEFAFNVGDHQVADLEGCAGVGGVDLIERHTVEMILGRERLHRRGKRGPSGRSSEKRGQTALSTDEMVTAFEGVWSGDRVVSPLFFDSRSFAGGIQDRDVA